MSNQIKKRTTITNEIFAELEKKYPIRREKSGVCYAQDMDYVTLEVLFYENADFRILVKQNNQIFIAYMLLRKSMCLNGWNVLWTDKTKLDLSEKVTLWGIAETDFIPYVQLLIDNGLIWVVNRDGQDYLTDPQQIYNWEMLQSKRARDRKSKSSEGKAKKKTAEPQDNTENELMEEHFSTYEQDIANYYNNNCYTDENGSLAKSEEYVKEYIETRLNEGKSVYTLKMERSALSMVYGHSIDITLPVRHSSDVKRSREDTVNDKHISRSGKYADVFTVACSSGCRRCDMYSLTVNSLIEKDGRYFLDIRQSKGGRDRLAPILPENVEQVKAIFEKAKEIGAQRIFEYIPKEIDIHSLRREYAKDLYHTLTDDKSLRDTYLDYYPPRAEKVKSDFYKDRQGNVFERDTVYVVSQALGHNRIDTSITSYLK